MAPPNKQDEPYLEQKENMSTLQPSQDIAELLRLLGGPGKHPQGEPLRERSSGSL
jgi:hypothetical protein